MRVCRSSADLRTSAPSSHRHPMTASDSPIPTPTPIPTGSNSSADPYPNNLFDVLLSPPLERVGLYYPPDPTYGRYLLPNSEDERELEESGTVRMGMRRVFLRNGRAILSHASDGGAGAKANGDDKLKLTSKAVNGGGVSGGMERGEDVKLVESELLGLDKPGRSREWVFYKTWQRGVWNRCDVVCIHGTPFPSSISIQGRRLTRMLMCR